jgi:hypothetical protein
MPILSIARKLGIPGTRRISPECGMRDKHDNGRTSSDRAGDAEGIRNVFKDLCKSAPAELAGNK